MTAFEIEPTPDAVCVRLNFDVTIEHARDLHAALVAALLPGRALSVDASALTRIDAAILQVLLAAVRSAAGTRLTASSPVWSAALARHGVTDPFVQP